MRCMRTSTCMWWVVSSAKRQSSWKPFPFRACRTWTSAGAHRCISPLHAPLQAVLVQEHRPAPGLQEGLEAHSAAIATPVGWAAVALFVMTVSDDRLSQAAHTGACACVMAELPGAGAGSSKPKQSVHAV